jgi:hypothetical protein
MFHQYQSLGFKKREEEMRRGGMPEEITNILRPQQLIFFDIKEINFSLIPQVTAKTLAAAAKVSNAKVSSFNIRKRQDLFAKVITLEWRVDIYGDRSKNESVIFDGQGNLKNAN